MSIERNVILDLLPLYFSDEASPETGTDTPEETWRAFGGTASKLFSCIERIRQIAIFELEIHSGQQAQILYECNELTGLAIGVLGDMDREAEAGGKQDA